MRGDHDKGEFCGNKPPGWLGTDRQTMIIQRRSVSDYTHAGPFSEARLCTDKNREVCSSTKSNT